MTRPRVVAHHARSGRAALNVVTAALDADARTAGADVVFAGGVDELVDAIDTAAGPVLVLWSFYSPDFETSAADLARVRARTSRGVHVAGGVHATAEPLATLRASFDVVALGEGETSIVELVARGGDAHGLAGFAYLERDRLVSHGPGPRAPLDAFPSFNERFGKWNPIELTRGCVYACAFCQTPYVFKARFRHRSVENARGEVARMHAQGARFMRFVTPTSLSYGSEGTEPNLAAVEALLRAVREELGEDGAIYFGTFPSEVRPEHLTREALEVLARWADNRSLIVGAQSGSDRLLEATRRGHGVAEVVRAVETCRAMGFRADVDFLFGLPGETEADRAATFALADRLVAMGARIHSHAFMPLPGTPLRDAVPTPIDEATALGMARLESEGAMYGQWRRHVVIAERLVRARRGGVSSGSE